MDHSVKPYSLFWTCHRATASYARLLLALQPPVPEGRDLGHFLYFSTFPRVQMSQMQQHLEKRSCFFLKPFLRASLSQPSTPQSNILGYIRAVSLTPGAARAMGSPLKRGLMWQLGADKPLISSPFGAGGDCQPRDTMDDNSTGCWGILAGSPCSPAWAAQTKPRFNSSSQTETWQIKPLSGLLSNQ